MSATRVRTIDDLIAELMKYPSGTTVLVDGWEAGLDDAYVRAETVAKVSDHLDHFESDAAWAGKWVGETDSFGRSLPDSRRRDAVIIGRFPEGQ